MEQSASASLLAMCSVVVLPVVAHDPMLVAVYAIAMGPAQAVSNVAVSMSRIRISLLILHDLAPQVKATGRSRIDAVVTSGSRVLAWASSSKFFRYRFAE